MRIRAHSGNDSSHYPHDEQKLRKIRAREGTIASHPPPGDAGMTEPGGTVSLISILLFLPSKDGGAVAFRKPGIRIYVIYLYLVGSHLFLCHELKY